MSSNILFIDSDVIISFLLSSSGASHHLIKSSSVKKFISSLSFIELEIVIKRMGLDRQLLNLLISDGTINITKLKNNIAQIKKKYLSYVKDENDAHIVAGTVESKAKFLITYNVRHFQINKIKEDYKIIIMTPGSFLQYLRSK